MLSFLLQLLQAFEFLWFEEVVDATEVFADATVAELVDLGDESVKEVAVVTNHDEGAVKVLQGLFKNVFSAKIQYFVVKIPKSQKNTHTFGEIKGKS